MKKHLQPLYGKFVFLFLTIIGIAFFFQACEIEEPQAPRWDVELNVPIMRDETTLLEILERDTTNIKFDGTKVYYKDVQDIETIGIDADDLTLESQSTTVAETIGPITIKDIDPVERDILLEEWNPDQQKGNQVVFDPVLDPKLVISEPDPITAFERVIFDEGTMKINLTNNYGLVEIRLHQVTLRNKGIPTMILGQTFDPPLVFAVGETEKEIEFDLAGANVPSEFDVWMQFSSPGSDGAIDVPQDAKTHYTITFEDIVVAYAEAELPSQEEPITKDSTTSLDDSTYIHLVDIAEGNLNITVDSKLGLPLEVTVTLNELMEPDNTPFTRTFTLGRNGNQIITESLADWKIQSPSGTNFTNNISYHLEANNIPDNPGVTSTVSKDDSVVITVEFGELKVKTFQGIIKPTELHVDETEIELNLDDIEENLTYDRLQLDSSDIRINVTQSTGFDVLYSGKIYGENSLGTKKTLTVDPVLLKPGEETLFIDPEVFEDFLNSFPGKLPSKLKLQENTAIVNPTASYLTQLNAGTIGSVSIVDTVFGNVDINVPLKAELVNGVFTDTTNVYDDPNDPDYTGGQFGGVDTQYIHNANQVDIYVIIENGIPAEIEFSGAMFDKYDNKLFDIPPSPPNEPTIQVDGAVVDANGYVTHATRDSVRLTLTHNEFVKLTSGKYFTSELKINTSGADGQAVRFQTTNAVNVIIYGGVDYEADF